MHRAYPSRAAWAVAMVSFLGLTLWASSVSLVSPSLAAPSCDLSGPTDAPFTVHVQGEQVLLVVELWAEGAPQGWVESMLAVMEARQLPAVLVLPAKEPGEELSPIIARVRQGGSEVAVILPPEVVPRNAKSSLAPLREAVRPLKAHTGALRTAIVATGSRQSEAMLGRAGFRTLVPPEAPPSSEARMAGTFEGQPRVRVVLPPGLYEDACGPSPVAGPFGPRAADRAGLALQRAARLSGTPVVRLALKGSAAGPDDATVLGRWLDQVVLPGKVQVVTADRARALVLEGFRKRGPTTSAPEIGGRLVAIEALQEAAAALAEPTAVPRSLPGDLNPTEAFFGFVLLLADQTEGPVIRLGAMRGPASPATTTLSGPTELPREEVRQLAVALASALPTEVPAALSVDGRLLTAGELLVALAGAVRGEDPVQTRPVAVPEPNERGLGWGESTLP